MPDHDNYQINTDGVKTEHRYPHNSNTTANHGEMTIDLSRVFGFMKSRKQIFAIVLVICVLIGASVPLLLYQLKSDDPAAIAVITYRYSGAENGTAPDGTELNVSEIKSSYVIQNALDNVLLSKKVSFSDVASNISVEGILTEDTMRKLEILQDISDDEYSYKQYYELMTSLEFKYGNQYIITLDNSFGKSKTVLPSSELKVLLKAIVNAYNDYFFDTYSMQKLPENTIDAIELDSLEYIEQAEYLDDVLKTLLEYCNVKSAEFPSYRSADDGLSFADIADVIKTTREINVAAISSEISVNHVSKDYDNLLTSYDYYIREAQIALKVAEESLASVKKMIEDYKNEQLVIMSQQSESSQTASQSTEYYNSLVIKQMNISKEIAELNSKIAEYRSIVDKFSNQATYSDTSDVEADLDALYDDCVGFYKLIYEHAEELFSTSYFKNTYIGSMVVMETSDGLSDTAADIGIGAASGLIVGLVIWIGYGFAEEIKSGGKDADETAA